MVRKLLVLCGKVLTILNKLLPKKQKRIMFYSNLGFRDNGKALFDYLIEHKAYRKYEIIVSTNDYKSITHHPNVKYMGCFRGLPYFMTSKYFFYSFGKYPIMPSDSQIVINLWHGMPLKRIGNLEPGKENNKYDYFSYILSTSPLFDEIMEKSFNCEKDRILHFGQPRTDAMFEAKKNISDFEKYNKVFIWMPTFRVTDVLGESNTSNEDNVLPLIKNESDYNDLNTILKKDDCLLLIKLHPIQSTRGFISQNKSNIRFIDEEYLKNNDINLYMLLASTDALITDYSSVYFDYLLLDKPILFITADIEDYKENRGLNFQNPLSMMPGPHVNDFDMFIQEINNISNDIDRYKDNREKLNIKLNQYVSHHNSRDITDFCHIDLES